MIRSSRHATLLMAVLLPCAAAARIGAQAVAPLDPVDVRRALIERVNDGSWRGLAISWREGDRLRIATAGVLAVEGAAIDGQTRFQLGELGQVLTVALLANLVTRGEVSLDDLAQRFLPSSIRLPTRNGRAITLGDLAFHRSGLPDPTTAGAAATTAALERALRGATLRTDIGARYTYSRLGIDLLGVALSRHLQLPLGAAIRSRILAPLAITDIALLAGNGAPFQAAVGHDASGRVVRRDAAVSGGWSGSVTAMARLLAAAGDTSRGPLASTFALMMRSRSAGPESSSPVALGWRVLRLDDRDIYWHDAQDAPGFAGYAAIDPVRGNVAVVLGNSAHPVDAIAGQILLGRVPVIAPIPSASAGTSRSVESPRTRRPGRRR